jgi:hypothetical protein
MLPPERRLGQVMELIDARKFFTLHAGRQTGKTTSLMWLERHYAALDGGRAWRAIWVDLETAREQPDLEAAMSAVLTAFEVRLGLLHLQPRPDPAWVDGLLAKPTMALSRYLTRLAELDPRPLLLLLDEVDGLVGPGMVSFLTQLRQGYIARSQQPFPASVVLVGQRQVRDYVLSADERRSVSWLGTTSPFNITAAAATLDAFTEPEVTELLGQHTAATSQSFAPDAARRIWELGQGHPWLTCALADQITRRDVKDRAVPITAANVEAAKETIILARRSHIDSLVARLREPRVCRVLDPMLAGELTPADVLDDDFAYVLGLGLIRVEGGRYEIANPVYREIIPRALTYTRQMQIANAPRDYVRADGALDFSRLMADWQVFWREHGHLAAEGFGYRESGPHLMLMAFLQRVVNGGGRIDREYGLGRGALDLMITWKDERHAVEVKLRRDTQTEEGALDQVARYLDRAGLDEGWLVMFDLRGERAWEEKLTTKRVEHRGKVVQVVGC